VREKFVENGEEVADLEVWKSTLDLLVLHPGVVLEFGHHSENEVYSAKNTFTSRVVSSLDTVHPHVEQHLYDGSVLVDRVDSLLSNLSVELGSEEGEVTLSGEGIQVLVFYILLQEIAHSPSFVQGLKSHPRYSQEDLRKLASFSIGGKEVAVEYDIVSDLHASVVLNSEIEEIEALANL